VNSPLKRRLKRFAKVVSPGAATPPPERPEEAVVSLTFDDGLDSQRIAAELLSARGLAGTFYVPSGLVARKGRLGWDDLRALAEQGHEVGGHTSSHAHLTELDAAAARREIEGDRNALLERDLDPVTFAYPYGEASSELELIVEQVGYRAARGIGGIVETVPPENVLRLRTPHSARGWTTTEQLAAFVHVAEHEGGWMIVPFHHIEPDGSVGSSYTTEPSQLVEFLDWLVARGLRVARVRDVVASTTA
jgi:peptidoglycan/xylan/chitin deacetylase (PgdA/CDA1 family)